MSDWVQDYQRDMAAAAPVARKILDNLCLTTDERAELRRNWQAVLAELKAIFMRERRWEK